MEFGLLAKLHLIFITAISVHNSNSNAPKNILGTATFLAIRFGMFFTCSTIEGGNLENAYYFLNPISSI